jgi:hypothetical protein
MCSDAADLPYSLHVGWYVSQQLGVDLTNELQQSLGPRLFSIGSRWLALMRKRVLLQRE